MILTTDAITHLDALLKLVKAPINPPAPDPAVGPQRIRIVQVLQGSNALATADETAEEATAAGALLRGARYLKNPEQSHQHLKRQHIHEHVKEVLNNAGNAAYLNLSGPLPAWMELHDTRLSFKRASLCPRCSDDSIRLFDETRMPAGLLN